MWCIRQPSTELANSVSEAVIDSRCVYQCLWGLLSMHKEKEESVRLGTQPSSKPVSEEIDELGIKPSIYVTQNRETVS